jgi:hypothetical protein
LRRALDFLRNPAGAEAGRHRSGGFRRAVCRRQHRYRWGVGRQFQHRCSVGFCPYRSAWTQQGSKLVGTGAVGSSGQGAGQGMFVALSADGNTAIVGGDFDNSNTGAVWVFAPVSGHMRARFPGTRRHRFLVPMAPQFQ